MPVFPNRLTTLVVALCASLLAVPCFAADRDSSFVAPPIEVPTFGKTASEVAPPTSLTASTASQAVTPAAPAAEASSAPVAAAQNAASSAPSSMEPVELAKPVASETLAAINPDTLGLLSSNEGGFGASMWENTPRALVDKLLPSLNLPTNSPALNSLARRLLLSTAAVPVGEKTASNSLVSIRLEKLLSLGDAAEAWQLSSLAKTGQIDTITMRLVIEAALMGPDSKAVCDKMSDIMAGHSNEEWQKALVLCQLRAGDTKAAQLSLDVMREQQVKDDMFILLVNRVLTGDHKRLPRQLTPLRPLTLGVLRQLDVPLPQDIYTRPDAVLIPELLEAKAESEVARLSLVEKAATRGIINSKQVADVYRSVPFSTDELAGTLNSNETGARLHALLFQAAEKETASSKRAELIGKFVQSSDAALLGGAVGQALAELAMSIQVISDYNLFSASAARLFALAGKPDRALEWLKIAQGPASKLPNVASDVMANWPLFVLSGIVTDAEYGTTMKSWLDGMLKDAGPDPASMRAKRQQIGNTLMLFSAAGYAVPEDAWMAVLDGTNETKRMFMPSALLLERLRLAANAGRRGETVLLSLVLASGGVQEAPLLTIVEVVKALRLVGLTSDSLAFAREAAVEN